MTESRPVVGTLLGQLRGVIQRSINDIEYAAFKGIPYATPPVGELRFEDPLPAQPWSGVLDASKFGQHSAQLDSMTRQLAGSDDCLYLNVYTPWANGALPSTPKPVMFWIHGGAFAYGSGDDMVYGPDYIVEKDIVLVTINYRLNVLGFLNLEDGVIGGNQGLKDQVLALKWVKENIANFGGDSENVTIFGESAGASSVHYVTLSPLADGLYHKAISQSGTAVNPWASVLQPRTCAQKLAAALGKDTDDPRELLAFLRGIDAQKLAEVDSKLSREPALRGHRYFVPSVDAKSKNPFLPIPVKAAVQKGVKVPYLLGHTSHEGILFLVGMNDARLAQFDAQFEEALSPGVKGMMAERGLTPDDIKEMYFGEKHLAKDTIFNYMQMHSELQFFSGIHEVAVTQVEKSYHPTYLYVFSYDSGNSLVKSKCGIDMPGTSHADDLPYIFYPRIMKLLGMPHPEVGSTQRLVIDRFVQMWTNFAKTGNPTPAVTDLLPVIWKPLTSPEYFDCMNIGADLKMEVTTNINKRLVKKSRSNL